MRCVHGPGMNPRRIPAGLLAAGSSALLLALTVVSISLAPGSEIPAETAHLPGPSHNGTSNDTALRLFVGMEHTGRLLFHGSPGSLAGYDLYILDGSHAGSISEGKPPPAALHHLRPGEHDLDLESGRPVLALEGSGLTRHPYEFQGSFRYVGEPVATDEACEPGLDPGRFDPHTVCRAADEDQARGYIIHRYDPSDVIPVPTRLVTGYTFAWLAPTGTSPEEVAAARDDERHLADRSDLYFTAIEQQAFGLHKALLWLQWTVLVGLALSVGVVAMQARSRTAVRRDDQQRDDEEQGPSEVLLLLMRRAVGYLERLRRSHVFWAATPLLVLLALLATRLLAPDTWYSLARLGPVSSWLSVNVAFIVVAALTLVAWQAWQAKQIHEELARVRGLIERTL